MTSPSAEALLRLQSLSFEGAGTYRNSTGEIPLSKQGRVLLAGEEGAGKSMLPEVMTLVLYGKGSPRMRKTGLVESSIVNTAIGYSGTLSFESGYGASSRDVEITQSFKHKRLGSRYIITVDGQREEPDTKPEQKKLVKRLAPLSMGEWLGVVYLNQGAVHDLLAGTPTEKREYLTSVFGLDFYDDLLETAKEEQKTLKNKSANAIELKQQLADLEDEIKSVQEFIDESDEDQIESDLSSLGEKLQKLSKKLGKLSTLRKANQQLAEANEEIKRLGGSSLADTEAGLKSTKSVRDELVQEIARLKAEIKSVQKSKKLRDSAEEAVSVATEKVAGLKEKLSVVKKALKGAPSPSDVKATVRLLEQGFDEFNPSTVLTEKGGVPAARDWQASLARAAALGSTVAKLRKLKARNVHVCPTCNQDVQEDALDSALSALSEEIDQEREAAFNGFLLVLKESGSWWEGKELEDALDDANDYAASHETASKLKDRLLDAQERLEEAEASLSEVPEAEDPQGLAESLSGHEDSISEVDDEIDRLSSLKDLYNKREGLASTVAGLDLSELEEVIDQTEDRRVRTQERYDRLLETKTKLDQAVSERRSLWKQKSAVEDKIQEHAENALKIQHYELSLIPYFNSLRAAKVHSCASLLENVLPVYVSAMSAAQYAGSEIKLQISDDLKKVDLLLKAGRYSDWVSAVQSSGGQRRRFTLAIIAALREVSPRKANLMFFDEPFADLQGEGKLLFVNRLIPTLMDRCEDLESVFVIAHDQEVLEAGNDAFDDVWTAERDATGSRLKRNQRLGFVEGK